LKPLRSASVAVDKPLVPRVSIFWLVLFGGVFACLLTACASHQAAGPSAALVSVKERDYHIAVSRSRVLAGRVRITVQNAGPANHELIVVRASRADLPLRTDGLTVNEAAIDSIKVAALEPAGPGAVRRLDLTLGKGRYELFCNMAGHFMGGMHAFLVVR
jgi:hypothetical protein